MHKCLCKDGFENDEVYPDKCVQSALTPSAKNIPGVNLQTLPQHLVDLQQTNAMTEEDQKILAVQDKVATLERTTAALVQAAAAETANLQALQQAAEQQMALTGSAQTEALIQQLLAGATNPNSNSKFL